MPRGGKARHVGADLADDAFGAAVLDADDRAQQLNRRRDRADLLFDHAGELFDLLVQEIDVAQDRSDPQPMVGVEVSGERLAQRGDLLAHLLARQLGEHVRVGLAGDQRVEHVAPGLAQDVRGDRVELDAGVFERLVQPVDLTGALLDLRLAIAGEVAQLADRLGRHEVGLQQPRFGELAQPRRVGDVGLAAGDEPLHRLHESRPSLPEEVTVTAAHHPLAGMRLAVEGRRAVGGVACLIVRLPDGTPGTIELSATSCAPAEGAPACGLLSVEGVRRLRRLLSPGAAGDDGSGT